MSCQRLVCDMDEGKRSDGHGAGKDPEAGGGGGGGGGVDEGLGWPHGHAKPADECNAAFLVSVWFSFWIPFRRRLCLR